MKKTQKKTNRVGKTIGALLLSVVLLAGGGAVGYGAGTHWTFKNNGVQAAVPDGDLSAVNGNVLITGDENESHGIRLTSAMIAAEDFDEYGIDTQAETAQVLTATFTPANTTFQDVAWTVSGGDGKVTVTPIAGSPLKATVAVTGSFSQQAVVTCTSTYNTELYATATVDYLKMPSFSWGTSNNFVYINSIKDDGHINALSLLDDSTGTLSATSVSGTVVVYNLYYNSLKARHSSVKQFVEYSAVDLMNNGFTFNFADLLGNVSSTEKTQIYQEIAEDDTNIDIAKIYYSNIYFNYNGTNYWYSDGEDLIGYLTVCSFDDVVVFADGVSLDKGGLVFFPPQED